MRDLSATTFAPPGYSGLVCPTCDHWHTHSVTSGVELVTHCPGCGRIVDVPSMRLLPQAHVPTLLVDDLVLALPWYHATSRPGWLVHARRNAAPVHVGSSLAAVVRGRHGDETYNQPWWLYEVELAANTALRPGIVEDLVDLWPRRVTELRAADGGEVDAIRYLNHYEDPGNVSLLVDPHFIRVARVQQVDPAGVDALLRQVLAERA